MDVNQFLENVRKIADSRPSYRTGGDGSDGTCDCIGLIIGAVGREYPMHSTNYFARYEMVYMDPLTEDDELAPGDLVFKAKSETNPRYDLHERYRQGGRYFTGDLLDYYHVGVVTSAHPIEITHCTSTGSVNGIAYDNTTDGWTHFGALDGIEYVEDGDEPMAEAETVEHAIAIVYTEDGNPVRMRSAPSSEGSYNTIAKVPKGAQVEVLESADGWATVKYASMRGYMMSEYLRVIGAVTAEKEQSVLDTVTVELPRDVARALYEALGEVM